MRLIRVVGFVSGVGAALAASTAPCASGPSVDDLDEEEAIGFVVTAPPEALWEAFEGCRRRTADEGSLVDPPSEAHYRQLWRCARVAEALAEAAPASDRDRLVRVLETLTASDPSHDGLLRGLLSARLRDALESWEPARNDAIPSPPSWPELPERLAGLAPELQQAWQLQEALARGHGERLEAIQRRGEVQFFGAVPAFEATILEVVQGGADLGTVVDDVGRYVWGGTCGMGSERLYRPQSQVALLAFLARGDRLAAAGAVLALGFRGPSMSRALPPGWERQALRKLGFDWEAIFLGRMLDGDTEALSELARHGSSRAGRLLLEARAARDQGEEPLGGQDAYLHAVGALVPRTGHCDDHASSSSGDIERSPEAEPVGSDVEAEALDLLASQVGPSSGQGSAETAAHLLVRACRPESLPAFRAMAHSPYTRVREAGALARRSLGEEAPEVRPNPPVVVPVVVDGTPLSGHRLQWTLSGRRSDDFSWLSDSVVAEDGQARLERDPFLDPARDVGRLTLATGTVQEPGDLWFAASQVRPHDLDRPSEVAVRTQALTLHCPEAERTDLRLALWSRSGDDEPHEDAVTSGMKLLSARTTFSRLQRGRYQLSLFGREGHWESEEIELEGDPVSVSCGALEPFDLPFEEASAEPLP
jgi:hypothetical protein